MMALRDWAAEISHELQQLLEDSGKPASADIITGAMIRLGDEIETHFEDEPFPNPKNP